MSEGATQDSQLGQGSKALGEAAPQQGTEQTSVRVTLIQLAGLKPEHALIDEASPGCLIKQVQGAAAIKAKVHGFPPLRVALAVHLDVQLLAAKVAVNRTIRAKRFG